MVFGGQRLVRGHEIRQEPIDDVRGLFIGLLNGLPGRVPGTAKQVHDKPKLLGYFVTTARKVKKIEYILFLDRAMCSK